MKMIAHRGYWLQPSEKNTEAAFGRAIEHGYGIETDIRDQNGRLIVCHDVPLQGVAYLSFDALLAMYRQQKDKDAVLAINIKSDGLQHLLAAVLQKHELNAYFCFDMSFPTLFFNYRGSDLKFFSSINEYNRTPALAEECTGIWVDAYGGQPWYDLEMLSRFLDNGKQVCIVSPELHAHAPKELWTAIKRSGLHHHHNCFLCTDLPVDAGNFFNT